MKETRQSAVAQLRGVDRTNRTVDVIASTFEIDSYGTRIDQNGWDLERFKKNPVICLQHDSYGYSGSNGLPVAKAIPETIRVDNQKLLMRLQFPEEGKFPLADQVFNLVADGFLSGISVGFNPTEWEDTTEKAQDGIETTVRVYRKQELLETSIVTIPSNDAALVQRSADRNADITVIRRMTEQMETEIKKQAIDYKAYYDKKQPANRESTKVLERFFKKILKEEQPADEVAAWQRMDEAIVAMEEQAPAEEIAEPIIEEKPVEQEPAAEAAPIIEESPVQVPEAPVQEEAPPERSMSLSVLRALPKALVDVMENAAVEAALRGVPVKDLPSVKREAGVKYLQSISKS